MPWAVQCRGAGGEAPGEINFGAPPSPEGKGVGGMRQSKLKAGLASAKEGKPPGGDSGCKVGRRPTGQAPLRARGSPLLPAPGRRNETKSGRRHSKQAAPEQSGVACQTGAGRNRTAGADCGLPHHFIRPLSFSSISISVPRAFFSTTLSSFLSLKDSLMSVMGFLSMA